MSYDFRNDLLEIFVIFILVALTLLCANKCQAQKYNDGLTLDMVVERTPVYDSVTGQSTNSQISIERVRLSFPNRDVIILETQRDTLRLELISIWQNCQFKDLDHPGQFYTVLRDKRKKSFFFTFTPAFPLWKPNMYSIYITPNLPISGLN